MTGTETAAGAEAAVGIAEGEVGHEAEAETGLGIEILAVDVVAEVANQEVT